MIDTIAATGTVAMRSTEAEALAAFRAFNYDRIYLRDEAVAQAERAAKVITELCAYFIEHPERIRHTDHPSDDHTGGLIGGSNGSSTGNHHLADTEQADPVGSARIGGAVEDPVAAAVRYVSGMTDRYLLRCAVEELGWDTASLPMSV